MDVGIALAQVPLHQNLVLLGVTAAMEKEGRDKERVSRTQKMYVSSLILLFLSKSPLSPKC
jgi:hypothetical protein